MGSDIPPPKIFSREFHTEFFPRLLKDRLRRKKRGGQGTTFTSTTEMIISLAVCVVLAVIGIPSAWTQGSVFGWILSIAGIGGIVGLVILSVSGSWGERPSYDDFLVGIFFFFVSLGLIMGIAAGMDRHSFWLGLVASLAGLGGGYGLGILAGLRMQHLGWMAVILNMLAAFGAIILGATALFLLVVLVV